MKGIEKIRLMLALMLVSMKRRLPETRRLSTGITTLTLAGIVLLVAAGSASAYDSCPAPGDTVITASCTLDQSYIVPAGQAGYIIGADGVTIDGAGYKITGSVTFDDCSDGGGTNPCTISGIYNEYHDDVAVKNLEIEGFCTGVAFKGGFGDDRVYNNTVDNCNIHHNGINAGLRVTHGVHVCNVAEGALGAPAITITNNEIHHNDGTGAGCDDGGNGIYIFAGAPDSKHEYCNISYNDLHHNAKAGIWTKMMLSRCDITHNHAWENGHGTTDTIRGGIVLRCMMSNENFIAYNNASNNVGCCDHLGNDVGHGIYVGGSNNTIFDNIANNNTASGICMGRSDGSDYNNVSSNTACGNKGCCCFNRADIGACEGAGPAPMGCCGNYGTNNTCDICLNCDEDDSCNNILHPHHCPSTPEVDLEVIGKNETWNDPGSTYTVHYTIMNRGYAASNPTHAGISIDGTSVATQAVPAIPGFGTQTLTSGPHPVNTGVSVNGATYIDNVTVCADVNNEEPRDDKSNNCMSNNFGGPDLVIHPLTVGYVEWIDESWKTYNLLYTVENVGDIATTDDVLVNFTELHGEWNDCVNPVSIPAGLAAGAETGVLTAGPFTMGGDENWIEEWANFDHACPVNNWNILHHDRTRFTENYPETGPCWDVNGDITQCGDVNCDEDIDIRDVKKVRKRMVVPNYALDCPWAANAKCDDDIDIRDVKKVRKRMVVPNYVLNCCKGCDL
ncbi:MAG: right-handed parallel beta-helix repeat-containing protein [Euryarchaeota archaeon]|nr:right-handed parallel beta-helix repeat-containing protein [Euryarchaeota archaeon]